jgi:hypothetical protein
MASPAGLSNLEARKRSLVEQAALQRQALLVEQSRMKATMDRVHQQVRAHRWWLVGGAFLVGVLLMRRSGRPLRWLPMAASAWRLAQGGPPR